jgi:hypothetical protein
MIFLPDVHGVCPFYCWQYVLSVVKSWIKYKYAQRWFYVSLAQQYTTFIVCHVCWLDANFTSMFPCAYSLVLLYPLLYTAFIILIPEIADRVEGDGGLLLSPISENKKDEHFSCDWNPKHWYLLERSSVTLSYGPVIFKIFPLLGEFHHFL